MNELTRETHTEHIRCPECDHCQDAEVEHTAPWYSYVHTCNCGHVIMESEWDVVEKERDAEHAHAEAQTEDE